MPGNLYDEAVDQLAGTPAPAAGAEAPSIYDETIQLQQAGHEQRLRTSLVQADQTTPDHAAEAQKLGQRTGLPAEVVLRNFDAIKKRATLTDTPYSQMLRETPTLATWAAEPENAAVASDDMEKLGFLEWLVTAPQRGFARGVDQLRYGQLRSESLFRDLTQEERDQLNAYKFGMEKGGALGAGDSWFKGAITGAATQLPNLFGAGLSALKYGAVGALEGAVAGGAAGSVLPGVGTLAGATAGAGYGFRAGGIYGGWKMTAQLESGLAYDEYLAVKDEFGQPLDPSVAKAAALATGAINGGLELVGLDALMESIPGLKQLGSIGVRTAVKDALRVPTVRAALADAVLSYGKTLTIETATEVAQRAVTILSGELAKATGKVGQNPGQLEPGNVDLFKQPKVTNPDGSISTVDSVGVNVEGKELLLPTVTPDGRHFATPEEAIAEYQRTGKHLGVFESPAASTAYAQQLHEDYAAGKYDQASKFRSAGNIAADLLNEATGALQSFALTVLPGPLLEATIATQRARRAAQSPAWFKALGEGVSQSKTVERMPAAAQALLAQATQGGPVETVYAPLDTWNTYWQSKGVDPAEMAATVTGSRDAYEHATNEGGDLPIPTAAYAVKLAGTEHNEYFANELRLAPDEMNGREAADFATQQAEQAAAAPDVPAVSPVRARVMEQLTAAGVPTATAESYAALYESTFANLAARAGVDPVALDQQYGLTITRPGLQLPGRSELATAPSVAVSALANERLQQSPALEAHVDRPAFSPELLANLFKGEPLTHEGDRLVSAPPLQEMVAKVNAAALVDPEVFGAIVRAVPIDVVNNLFGSERAAEDALRNDPVFQDRSTLNADLPVPESVDATSPVGLLLSEVARAATEAPASSLSSGLLASKDSVAANARTSPRDSLRQDNRASISFGPNAQVNISLLEKADLSSFLHESGHLFLHILGDLATRPEASAQIRGDMQTVLTWAGYEGDLASWRALPVEQQRAVHEQFAKGFEAYLFEGKAPSVALRSTFARFRAWLVGIYRHVKALGVSINPEIRGVFDRLIASDQAIAHAEAQRGVSPMFTTAESAGMSEADFGLYRQTVADAHRRATEELDRTLLSEVRREQTAQWQTQRDAVETAVTDEVHQQPVYRALAAMQRGTHPNGEVLIEGQDAEPLKLSKAIIVDRYGEDRLKSLPRPYVYTREGGLDPNAVAEMFGFSSGDELLTAIAQAPPMTATIQQETDRRMLAQHGSLLLDGTLIDHAKAAVANEDRDAIIRAELRALAGLRRTVDPFVRAERAKTRAGAAMLRAAIPPAAQIRAMASDRIASMPIRSIRPQEFWSASRRAAAEAIDRAARQDFDGAIVAKQQELINLQLYREAERQLEDVADRVRFAQGLGTTATRKRIGLAGGNYLDQIDGILDRFEFARVSQRVLDRRGSLANFVAGVESTGQTVDLPAELLDESRRRNYQELTLEEFQGVTDGLKAIVHLAQLKNRLLKNQDQREFAAVRDGLVASVHEHNATRPAVLEFRPADDKWRTVSDWFASHRKISDILQAIDGYVDGGPLWSAIMRPLNVAADAEQTRKGEAGAAYAAILEQHYPGRELGRMGERIYIPAIDASLSKEARLAVALNWGNQTSRDRILSDPTRRWTQEQVGAILDTLDQRDWDFVQATWDHINGYWPEIAAKQQRVTGLAPEKVEALPVQTKFGEYAGGYYPLAYDTRLSVRAAQHEAASQAKLTASAAYVRSTTKRGHVEARQQNVKLSVRLELGVAFNHIEQVLHDLTHHETLIDVTRLLRDSQVSKAIVDTKGDIIYQQLTRGLQDIAIGSTPAAGNVLDRAANYMRTGTQIAGLGWNLWTGAQQPLGMFNGMARVGPVWVARGLGRWMRDAATMENTTHWIASVSPMMHDRVKTGSQDLHDLRAAFRRPGGWFDTLVRRVSGDAVTQQTITDSFLWHIGLMQRVADVPTWLGQYEKSRAAGETDERAYALADQAVLDSQGGGQVKDLALVQRGAPLARLWMTFYSYGNTVYNATSREVARTNFKSPAEVAEFLGHLSLLYVMPAVATIALSRAFGKSGGGGDDTPEGWAADIGKEMLSTALNTMVLVREMGGLVQEGTRGYAGPAGARTVELFYNLYRQVEQGKADEGLWKAANSVAGVLFRYPAMQVQRTIDGWVALQEGKTSNPAALLMSVPKAKK